MAKEAFFAGGCFWCIEAIYNETPGVIKAVSGYIGDTKADYERVSAGETKHREGVKVVYDPEKISYKELIEIFWRNIDPTDESGQFHDRGFQYTTAIYYSNDEEKKIAEKSKAELEKSGRFDKPIVTEILPAKPFYEAEDYHQEYSRKHPLRYNLYKKASGRDAMKKYWN